MVVFLSLAAANTSLALTNMSTPQVFTREDRLRAIQAAGFPESEWERAVAISLAESWQGQQINNSPPWEYSVGPWQINLLAHPHVHESQAQELTFSTQYAYSLWQERGWQPWGAFTDSRYLDFLNSPSVLDTGGNTLDAGVTATPSKVAGETAGLIRFEFPQWQVDLGLIRGNIDSSPLFKVAITIGALFLIFKGVERATA